MILDDTTLSEVEKVYSAGFQYLVNNCQDGLFPCFLGNDPQMKELMRAPLEAATPILAFNLVFRNCLNHPTSKSILQYIIHHIDIRGHYPFFNDPKLKETDTETTSFVLASLLELGFTDRNQCMPVVEAIKRVIRPDGLLSVYFEPVGGDHRIDHVSASNTLYFLYLLKETEMFVHTEEWIFQQLRDGTYLNGSRYYPSPDTFLYFLSRLSSKFPNPNQGFAMALRDNFQGRIGSTETPLDVAMRVTTARRLGVCNEQERTKLIAMQQSDGSWPANGLFKYGAKKVYIGSPSITTVFALEALGL